MKRDLILFILGYLEREFDYLILRNYEGLPEKEGHDIDVLIQISQSINVKNLLNELEHRYDIKIYKNYRYYCLMSHIIVFKNDILHLDFFTAIQWNRTKLFKTKDLLKDKQRFKNFWVLNTTDFNKYCWFLFLIRRGHLKKEKYLNAAFIHNDSDLQKMKFLDITKKSSIINYSIFYLSFFTKNPIAFSFSTIKNFLFKVKKIFNLRGRIFLLKNESQNQDLCIKFCFISSIRFIENKKDIFSFFKIYIALINETAVIISDDFLKNNQLIRFLFSNYFISLTDDLQKTVKSIMSIK